MTANEQTKHVAIWLDHTEAKVFHIRPEKTDEALFMAVAENTHRKHPRGETNVKSHPDDEKRFFHDIARSLDGKEGILIVGPSTAKLEFLRYLHKHDQAIEKMIVGVETVDHPTNNQVIAYAKKYFAKA